MGISSNQFPSVCFRNWFSNNEDKSCTMDSINDENMDYFFIRLWKQKAQQQFMWSILEFKYSKTVKSWIALAYSVDVKFLM